MLRAVQQWQCHLPQLAAEVQPAAACALLSALEKTSSAEHSAPSKRPALLRAHVSAGCIQTSAASAVLCARSFACAADHAHQTSERQAFAAELLQQVQVRELIEAIESKAQREIVMPEAEVRALAAEFVKDPGEITRVLGALQTTGAILRYHDKYFIRASEVAESVVGALPDTKSEAEAKVQEIEAELAPMDAQHRRIERRAFLWRSAIAYSGLAVLLVQFAVFARLTYWELSWDVMEPVSYFTGQLVMIGCYVYFLLTQTDFGYEQHFSGIHQKSVHKLMRRQRFDHERYAHLKHELARWQRYAHALARRKA